MVLFTFSKPIKEVLHVGRKQLLSCFNIGGGGCILDYIMPSGVGGVVKILHKLSFLGTSEAFVFKRYIRSSVFIRIAASCSAVGL